MSIRRDLKIAERRRDVATLYLRGFKQVEIAAKWKVSQQMISLDLKWLHAEWIGAALMDVNEAKARELARIDALELEYWHSWQESKDPLKREIKTARRGSPDADGKERVAYISDLRSEVEERVGDSRYLDGVRWCIEQRLKIFGVYAPTKIAPTTPDGQSEWSGMSDSELQREFERLVQPDAAGARINPNGNQTAAGAQGGGIADAAPAPD